MVLPRKELLVVLLELRSAVSLVRLGNQTAPRFHTFTFVVRVGGYYEKDNTRFVHPIGIPGHC